MTTNKQSTMKTELSNVCFEFKRGEELHVIIYEFCGIEKWERSCYNRKTFRVWYAIRDKVLLSCGKTQVSPCLSDAKTWLKDALLYIKANPDLF